MEHNVRTSDIVNLTDTLTSLRENFSSTAENHEDGKSPIFLNYAFYSQNNTLYLKAGMIRRSQHWFNSPFLASINELKDVSASSMLFPEAWQSAHSTGRLGLCSLQ